MAGRLSAKKEERKKKKEESNDTLGKTERFRGVDGVSRRLEKRLYDPFVPLREKRSSLRALYYREFVVA